MFEALSTLSRAELAAVAALEVFFAGLVVFVAGIAGLPPFIWFVLAAATVTAQSVLFYSIGREREKLGL